MNTYQRTINELTHLIIQNKMKYSDTIIIGENSIGKSDLLKELVKNRKFNNMYFMDCVNRKFDVTEIDSNPLGGAQNSIECILRKRLSEEYFNLKDSFSLFGVDTDRIGQIYFAFVNNLNELLKEFLDINISVKEEFKKYYAFINGKEQNLSNGIQAIIRIFLEIFYYDVNSSGDKMFIIDEIDEYLSPSNAGRLLPFLKDHYPYMNFVVSTHSIEVVASAKNCNIIAMLEDGKYEILDSNDYDSIIEANRLFLRVFSENDSISQKQQIDQELNRLFNNRITGELSENDKRNLEQLKTKELTKAQGVLLKQIEEW